MLRQHKKNICDLDFEIIDILFDVDKNQLIQKEKLHIRNEKIKNTLNTNVIF